MTAAGEAIRSPAAQAVARVGSLTRRMIVVAALWITALLLMGGFALDRVLSSSIVDNFDEQLTNILNAMIAASEIGPDGEVRFNRPPADQRFIEPYSGVYFQISGEGADTFPSRSLWDRRLRVQDQPQRRQRPRLRQQRIRRTSRCGSPSATSSCPDPKFAGASRSRSRARPSTPRSATCASTLFWSFVALGIGLLILAALQTFYGLWPLRRVRQRSRRDPLGREDSNHASISRTRSGR